MEFLFTARFKRAYKKLSEADRRSAQKKLALMSGNPHHPSLRTKKVQGTENIFECSITMSIRLTWQYEGDSILLRAVGDHDDVLKNP
jgi:mRNA-degrading endonuclease YafQ of YafQ-DinJ toxin-antitoxin module